LQLKPKFEWNVASSVPPLSIDVKPVEGQETEVSWDDASSDALHAEACRFRIRHRVHRAAEAGDASIPPKRSKECVVSYFPLRKSR